MSPPLPSIPVQQLAAIGPYFTLGATGADSRGWLPASSLVQDAEHLGQVIDEVAARLGTTQRWIAASIFYQGWAARLTSIYAGSAVLCGAVPDLRADLVRYRPRRSGPVDLSVVRLQPLSTDAGWRHLHDGHLAPLAAAVRARVRIGGYLLRGNAAPAPPGALRGLPPGAPGPRSCAVGPRRRPPPHARPPVPGGAPPQR